MHPEDGKPISAGLGRYGPFVLHAGTYANVADIDEVFEIGLNRAVVLLAEKRAGKFAGRGAASRRSRTWAPTRRRASRSTSWPAVSAPM
jgi:DNA topoisomerase-1